MAASGDAGDDLVPDPSFHPVRVEAGGADAETADDADVGHVLPGDPDQSGGWRAPAEDAGNWQERQFMSRE